MEVVEGFQREDHSHMVAVQLGDPSRVGEVRRAAVRLAADSGLDETAVGRVALIATELATNIVKHAARGEMIVRLLDDDEGLEMIAIDSGPGIADMERALRDGFSTAGSAGAGLGALQRLATTFDVFSTPRGTALVTRVRSESKSRAASALELGVVRVPKADEEACGDDWHLTSYPSGALQLLVADGLGHGLLAADASSTAMRIAAEPIERSAAETLSAVHAALRSTRGAAVAVAQISADHRSVRFSGVGNIFGAIVQPGSTKALVSHNGIAGHTAHRIQEFEYAWPPGALLIMHSDGLSGRWHLDDYPGLSSRQVSLIASVLYRDFTRRRDDAIVLVARAPA